MPAIPAPTVTDLAAAGKAYARKGLMDGLTLVQISGTYGTAVFTFEGCTELGADSGDNWFPVDAVKLTDHSRVNGSITPADDSEVAYLIDSRLMTGVRLNLSSIASGTISVTTRSMPWTDGPIMNVVETLLPADSVEVVTAANVITASESGKTFFLNSATEFASTLPAPAAGLRFTFIVTAAPSGASYTITTTSSANIIKGHVVSSDLNAVSDGDFETAGCDTISFVDAKAVAGDRVDVWCDGTNYFASAFCTVFDAITFTTVS